MKRFILCFFVLLYSAVGFSQQTPTIGVSDRRPDDYALTNATIYVDFQTKLEGATLLVHEGRIKKAGEDVSVPPGYQKIDLKGKHIYPSFIDPYTTYGIPEPERDGSGKSPLPGRYGKTSFCRSEQHPVNWNEAIKSHYDAVEHFETDEKRAKKLRRMGFGTALSFRADGIARGTSALVTLTDESENKAVILPHASAHYSFDKGFSQQTYPTSLMGSIALLRQTLYDAEWYARLDDKPYRDITLEALNGSKDLPQIFEVENKKSLLRADQLGDAFGMQFIIRGNGDEYQMMDQVKQTGAPLILSLDFPETPSVEDPFRADKVSLQQLRHWELAPALFSKLKDQGITFAFTSQGTNKKTFFDNLRKALDHGLDRTTALKALTHTPARLLEAEDQLGSLEQGKLANFIITSEDLFDPSSTIYENWIQGKSFVIHDMDKKDHSGTYVLKVGATEYTLKIEGQPGKEKFAVYRDDTLKMQTTGDIEAATFHLNIDLPETEGKLRLAGWKEEQQWQGEGYMPDGSIVQWQASRYKDRGKEESKKNKDKDFRRISRSTVPFTAYGYERRPEQKSYLIKDATVWTNEEQGIVENLDVLVEAGKIQKVAQDIQPDGAVVIDGTGKHLTSGVIDEHSHIAIEGGTNEFSHAITPEVRIGDVVDPEDINIYRQLSGGVTAAQILHGSANPIGGQSAVIKHRWGASADELLIDGAPQFLKHALGENVKQSRLPAFISSRYPQTRMGVEAILRDAYMQAEEYRDKWEAYNRLSEKEKLEKVKPRKNLRMEAIAEVLRRESFITCHTYVKSETNMIMNLAEDFGVKAHTLIHNTEGYKIADKLRDHGVYASNLPDWWAYKFEVYDAIPYNTSIQTRAGIVSAIHSDNAELARRLNQEAAKTVKYGGLSQEEAWKLVTLNPAKILHLDHRMGSIKKGKDADLVLWSHNPLTIYARAEKTMVDGIIYYDRQRDKQMRKAIEEERNRLINKILNKSNH